MGQKVSWQLVSKMTADLGDIFQLSMLINPPSNQEQSIAIRNSEVKKEVRRESLHLKHED